VRLLDAIYHATAVPDLRPIGLACVLVASFTSLAGAEPRSLTYEYSPYELLAIRDAESRLGARVDPNPEGKMIERVDFVRIDPIDVHDPLPLAVDRIHATSRASVLRHELLTREGDPWRKVMIDESARNLRLLPQLSLVLCVPMVGSSPDRVRLVVITKDVWSLYVDFDIAETPGGLELLDLEPKETNVAGLQHTVLGRFVLTPKTYTLGASYEIPRLDGRWLDLFLDGDVIVNRDSGQPEGTYGSAHIRRPLYSSRSQWAWTESIAWTDQIDRRYSNAQVATFQTSPTTTPVQWVWRERTVTDLVQVTRSLGWETKNDFSFGASLSRASYLVPDDASADATARAAFEAAQVPVGEDRVGPFVQWHGYKSDFQRVFDLDSLSLQEDNRLGHDLWLRVYPVLRAFGATRDFLGAYAAAAHSVPLGDGFVRATLASTIEGQTNLISDASWTAALAIVTPRFGVGRLVFDATVLNRWRNYLNVFSTIGGDSLLRGYPTRYFLGKDMLAMNLEYRSVPIDVKAVQLAAAAFYDVGDAFDGFDNLVPHHSVGIGLRVGFPQITRDVLRLDVGFPIPSHPPSVPAVGFFLAFRQAISLPAVGGGYGP
jgi:hypothetical protein